MRDNDLEYAAVSSSGNTNRGELGVAGVDVKRPELRPAPLATDADAAANRKPPPECRAPGFEVDTGRNKFLAVGCGGHTDFTF